ncbi:MAG: GlsB/YeaQ/YmgE family stress response membrane protein [Anaerolineae bacterium]|nr:GlsB/YeaQ/YmgE family stress response membrane protein [Anaerolineae bacterium]
MNCIVWIIIGVVAGALARRLMGSKDASWISDLILGLVGSFVGGFILGLFNIGDIKIGLGIGSIITAVIGAVVLIFIGRLIQGRR